jgi:hypothetical protein
MDFIDEFISSCTDNGITNISDISKKASSKIKEIDCEISRLTALKESYKKVVLSLDLRDDSNFGKDGWMVNSIISVFENIDNITSGEIIRSVGDNIKNPELVYTSNVYKKIKALEASGILKKNPDRTYSKGHRWNDKNNIINIK